MPKKQAKNYPTICSYIRFLRKEHHLSQMSLSLKSGFSQSSISRYESGDTKPPFEFLRTISKLYRIDLDFLLVLSYEDDNENIDILIDVPSSTNGLDMPKKKHYYLNIFESGIIDYLRSFDHALNNTKEPS